MWQDPIIAEIHQTRDKISRSYGNDLHAIFTAAQRGELSKPPTSTSGNTTPQGAPADHLASASLRQDGS